MKSTLLAPLYLLALTLLFVVPFTLLALAATVGAAAGAGVLEAFRATLPAAGSFAFDSLPLALVVAIFFTALRTARRPAARPLALLLPLVTAAAILFYGALGAPLVSGRPGELPLSSYVVPRTFSSGAGPRFMAQGVAERELTQVVVVDSERSDRTLWYFATAVAESPGAVALGGRPALGLPQRPAYASLFVLSERIGALRNDVGMLAAELGRAAGRSPLELIAVSAALAAFFWFSAFLVRATRWPAANVLLLLLAWRGALAGFRIMALDIRPELGKLVGSELLTSLSPALVLAVAGVACLLLDLAFFPFAFWKREIQA